MQRRTARAGSFFEWGSAGRPERAFTLQRTKRQRYRHESDRDMSYAAQSGKQQCRVSGRDFSVESNRSLPVWWNWYTQCVQSAPGETLRRFESSHRHQMSRQSALELINIKWLGKKVIYAPGRAGKVIDLSADCKRLLILRNQKRADERGMVVFDIDDPTIEIID